MAYETLKKMQAANRAATALVQYGNPLNETADMQNTLPSAILAAAMHIAGKKDVRYYLNGMLVEPSAAGAVCVSTDGHRMLVIRTNRSWSLGRVIIPRATCELLAKAKGEVQFGGSGADFSATFGSSRVGFSPVEGRYPEWRAVFPHDQNPHQTTGLDPVLLEGIAKAAKLLMAEFGKRGKDRSSLAIKLHGEFASQMSVTNFQDGSPVRAAGFVIMPMRVAADELTCSTAELVAP